MTLERSLYSLSRARLAALTLITLTFSTRNDEMKKLRVQNVKEREIESRKKRVRQEIKEEDAGSKKKRCSTFALCSSEIDDEAGTFLPVSYFGNNAAFGPRVTRLDSDNRLRPNGKHVILTFLELVVNDC
jgi:hypothetical protein